MGIYFFMITMFNIKINKLCICPQLAVLYTGQLWLIHLRNLFIKVMTPNKKYSRLLWSQIKLKVRPAPPPINNFQKVS